jgi:hypothetical protein
VPNPDLELRKPYATTPPSVRIVSCTKRGHSFLKGWVCSDGPPTHIGGGRYAVTLIEPDARTLMADAIRAGLEL